MNEFCFGKKSVPPLLYCNAQKKFDGNCECFFSSAANTVPGNLQNQNILLLERSSLYLTTWDQGIINIVWKEKNPAVPYAVGWSDLALFCDSWKATHFCRSGIFLGAEFQNIGNFRIHMRASQEQQSFHFQRITGTLQINIFFNICRNCPFTAKNNS